jgi:hypothetical protein
VTGVDLEITGLHVPMNEKSKLSIPNRVDYLSHYPITLSVKDIDRQVKLEADAINDLATETTAARIRLLTL